MANVVITSTANCIKFDFGIYSGTNTSSGVLPNKRVVTKLSMTISIADGNAYVGAARDRNTLPLTFNGSANTLQVDAVDGVAPTSNSDLYDKIIALLG